MNTAIWWIRRDLRLHDNLALSAAVAHGTVLPLFILDPVLLNGATVAPLRLAFLWAGLRALDADLRRLGSRLIVRQGQPVAVLRQLCGSMPGAAVFAAEEYTPYGRLRDDAVAAVVPLHRFPGLALHHPDSVRKADGTPFTVFTPFKRVWMTLPLPRRRDLLPAPASLPAPPEIASLPIPDGPVQPPETLFPPGEQAGRARLARFAADGMAGYAAQRDIPGVAGTALLSPYLRFGMVSAREAVVTALEADQAAEGGRGKSADTPSGPSVWLSELIWREFYLAILWHFPHVRERAFRPPPVPIAWRDDPEGFAAWCEGRTGYPFVDAAMRQLRQTGWMHNRTRMVTASFLTKHLLIDWRLGERWFMQHLIDGDLAANSGGWQWTAGVGTDASPWFRVFNPIIQGEKFDPDGVYVRRWVPELAAFPAARIQRPWEATAAEQAQAGCRIGRDYPVPIVDHAVARERALAAWNRL